MRIFIVPALLIAPMLAPATELPLQQVPVGATVEVPGFEYARGSWFSGPLVLKRVEVYAPDARILVPVPGGGLREIPRSDRRYFIAERGQTASRLFLSVAADGSDVRGSLFNAEQTFDFEGQLVDGRVEMTAFAKNLSGDHDFECGNLDHQHRIADGRLDPLADERFAQLKASLPKGATHQAVLAFDTDNELLSRRFSDNLTSAANYLADLVTGMNVAYARDLGFNLVQGTTVLRAESIGGADPYVSSSTSTQLGEVGGQWAMAPLLAESRAFVAFLSGKAASTNSGSGVAWILGSGSAANYCNAKDIPASNPEVVGHYSATQIIRGTGFGASVNVSLVGHEIGHNLGASHTHCSDRITGLANTGTNTIDQCFNADSGCYSGTPACPTDNSVNGRGSIMSYCNFTGGNAAGCGQVLNEFHPAHQTLLAPRVASNIGNGCFAALAADIGPTLSPTPMDGSTTAMPGGAQGEVVTRNISFMVSGGSGSGSTNLVCAGSGAVSVASGTPQTIGIGGSANPVVAQVTLGAGPLTGSVTCTATPTGAAVNNFTFNFTAAAGSAGCTGNCLFRNGFE